MQKMEANISILFWTKNTISLKMKYTDKQKRKDRPDAQL